MSRGHIYILFNPSLRQNRFKIGFTTSTPDARAREISRATGVPEPYEVAYSVYVEDCVAAERMVHETLEQHRVAKEFFELPLANAIRLFEEVADKIGRVQMVDDVREEKEERRFTTPARPPGPAKEELTIEAPGGKAARQQALSQPGPVRFEDHVRKTDASRQEILLALREQVSQLGTDVREIVTRANRIAYRTSRVFLEVKVHKDRIRILLLDAPFDDPRGLLERVPASHGWGRLAMLMNLRSIEDLEYATPMMAASYRHSKSR